jgi:hypothetical protein
VFDSVAATLVRSRRRSTCPTTPRATSIAREDCEAIHAPLLARSTRARRDAALG